MRTYYCVEIDGARYPVGAIEVRERPSSDPYTRSHSFLTRAASRKEAAEKVREELNREREQAMREQFEASV